MRFWKTWCLVTRGIIQAAFADITPLVPSVSPVAGERERRPRRKWRTKRVIVLSVRQNMHPDSPRGYISSRSTIKAPCIIQESCYPLYTHCKLPQSSNMPGLACLPRSCWFKYCGFRDAALQTLKVTSGFYGLQPVCRIWPLSGPWHHQGTFPHTVAARWIFPLFETISSQRKRLLWYAAEN